MLKHIIILMAPLICFYAIADGSDTIKVDSQPDYLEAGNDPLPVWRLTIISVIDNISINSAILNGGNCLISTRDRGNNVNQNIRFGHSFSFTTPSDNSFTKCKPLALKVNTVQATYTFTDDDMSPF